jgi:hypothetical protein
MLPAMELFGFSITKKTAEEEEKNVKSVIPQNFEDGAMEVAPGGSYGTYVDLEGNVKSEDDLVTKYREMALQPECDIAIEDIVNEAIVIDDKSAVELILDDLEQPKVVKNKIREEFENILKLLDFNNQGTDIFRQWYIDGRLYYHIMIDETKPREGIKELRKIDPRKIKKIREKKYEVDPRTRMRIEKGYTEYYTYFPKGIKSGIQQSAIKISKDSICHTTSGLMDPANKLVLGYLHKAIKPLNQLRVLEDATVIYRLARAPERRIFYIDVGNLPKMKAEQYLHDMMSKHKNKLVYDASTGQVRDDRKFMTMLEDFWLPRREGGKGTEITTLPGGQNLGEMEDVEYFKKSLYRALNVPVSRMETETSFNLGRTSEVTRDEVKFSKFIKKLRARFSHLFDNLLEIQLVLKGVVNRKQWKKLKEEIFFEFAHDSYFSELKETEILRERISLANDIDPFVGRYFSLKYVRQSIFKMTEEKMDQMDKDIKAEQEDTDSPMHPDNIIPPDGIPGMSTQPASAPAPATPKPKAVPVKKEEPKKAPVKEEIDYSSSTIVSEDRDRLITNMTIFTDPIKDEDEY